MPEWLNLGSTESILIIFAAAVAALLTADLLLHRSGRPISLRNAVLWSLVWIAASLAFAGLLAVTRSPADATLFLAGYTMEKVLSVDNLIVFGAIFAYFRIPAGHQHRILHWGVLGAIVFRLIFVTVGMGSLALFGPWVEGLLAALVAYSAWQMFKGLDGDGDDEIDHESRWYIRWTRRLFPVMATGSEGRFFIVVDGVRFATRAVLCLVAVEICDVLFSFDSVPAVIAVTQDAVLVYSAMIFAIMGLRSMYFVLEAMSRFLTQLTRAVLVVLVFIAAKLALHATGIYSIDPVTSLIVVVLILTCGVFASLLFPEEETA